ncbi:MAG: hypothetical protein ACLRZ3_13255 [Flavonifractor plautii]
METLDLSRRGVLLNDEQLGPYPLEKLKRVERLTVDIVEDSPRVDEKEMAFAKCRLGGFGDVLKKRMEDFTVRVPIGASYYHFQKYLNDYPENEVAPEKAPLPEDTRIVTRHIKKMAYFTGAEMVGGCEVPRDVYYATKVDGTPVERVYRYAVVFLVRTQLPTIAASHGDEWLDDTVAYQAYQRLACMSNTLADYIRRLGWPARSDAFNNYVTIMPRLVALAGLGEFSRLGIVVNPFMGAAFKAAAVLTDLPLVPDGPIDFGLQNYCSVCKICAEQCPMHAISTGEQEGTAATCSGDETSAGVWPRGGQPPRLYLRPLRQVCLHRPGGRSASGLGRGSVRALPLGRGPAEVLASHGYVEPERSMESGGCPMWSGMEKFSTAAISTTRCRGATWNGPDRRHGRNRGGGQRWQEPLIWRNGNNFACCSTRYARISFTCCGGRDGP